MGKQWKQCQTLFFGLQNHCRWWLQPWNYKTLASWKKSYDQPRQHNKNQRYYFVDKSPHSLYKPIAKVFPVVMYGCESWTISRAQHWRIDTFELWCWRRLLSVPWTARRSNQSILKEISSEYSLEDLTLKLKLQYFGHLIWRTYSFEKILMLGKIQGGRRRGDRGWDGWMASPTRCTWVWVNRGSWWWTGRPHVLQSMGSQDTTEQLNWISN